MINYKIAFVTLFFLLLFSCKKDDIVYQQLPTSHATDTLTEVLTGFEIFPNPFDSNVTFQFYLQKDDSITISIFSAVGQEKYKNIISTAPKGFYRFELNLGYFQQGLYFVVIGVGEKRYTKKILKN